MNEFLRRLEAGRAIVSAGSFVALAAVVTEAVGVKRDRRVGYIGLAGVVGFALRNRVAEGVPVVRDLAKLVENNIFDAFGREIGKQSVGQSDMGPRNQSRSSPSGRGQQSDISGMDLDIDEPCGAHGRLIRRDGNAVTCKDPRTGKKTTLVGDFPSTS